MGLTVLPTKRCFCFHSLINLILFLAIAFTALLLANNPMLYWKRRRTLSTVTCTGSIYQWACFHKLFKITLLPQRAVLHLSNHPASQDYCLWSYIRKQHLSDEALRARKTLRWQRGLARDCIAHGTCRGAGSQGDTLHLPGMPNGVFPSSAETRGGV